MYNPLRTFLAMCIAWLSDIMGYALMSRGGSENVVTGIAIALGGTALALSFYDLTENQP